MHEFVYLIFGMITLRHQKLLKNCLRVEFVCLVAVPSLTVTAPQKQAEPMFISVPPRPQRVLHSEAYIKYLTF